MSAFSPLLRKLKRPAGAPPLPPQIEEQDAEPTVPVGVKGVMAATEKLLAVNRGLTQPDIRDSMQFKHLMTTDKLLRERIRMDADRVRQSTLRRVARTRNLKSISPGAFDSYGTGLIVGNQLSMPLEEINPMHLVEQARRVSHMGQGGLGSDDAISADAQNVYADQFGYISPLEGPECHSYDSEVFTEKGWMPWPLVTTTTKLACRIDGRLEYHLPERVIMAPYSGEMIRLSGRAFDLMVTPNHRLWVAKHDTKRPTPWSFEMRPASEVANTVRRIDSGHVAYKGNESWTHFDLPVPERDTNNQKFFSKIPINDWCEFVGWYLSEGNFSTRLKKNEQRDYKTYISQSIKVNPDCFSDIAALLARLPFRFSMNARGFCLSGKQLAVYCSQFGFSEDKFIPEELFEAPAAAREKLLWALLKGDGRINNKHTNYCSVSRLLAEGFERLAISLGYTTHFRIEQDKRLHVKTTNYVVSVLKLRERCVGVGKPGVGGRWEKAPYTGMVYCATVPGGMLLCRRGKGSGIWSGNSARAGVDVRLAWGVKIGSDGRLYQKLYDKRAKAHRWMSPQDLDGKTVAFED